MDTAQLATLITSLIAIGTVIVGGVGLGMRQGRFEAQQIEKTANLEKSIAATDTCVDRLTLQVNALDVANGQQQVQARAFSATVQDLERRHAAAVDDLKVAIKDGFAELRSDIRALRSRDDTGPHPRSRG